MKKAYLAICYICNENCRFCPCSKSEKADGMITDIDELKDFIDKMSANGITDITLSGGEPTLHPDLPLLVRYIQDKEMKVTVLSNGEKFSDLDFLNAFLNSVDAERLRIITTLHSGRGDEHETANQVKGSFERTINGLLNLSRRNVKIIIKHCITKENYRELDTFYSFCDDMFDSAVDIQLCGIDYCGIPKNQLDEEMLAFTELRPYLEKLFDYHMIREKSGSSRKLYCINIPLCACDVVYWKYMRKDRKMYQSYKDPYKKEVSGVNDNVGISSMYCSKCKAASLCSGTYLTAFSAFGSKIIKPFI